MLNDYLNRISEELNKRNIEGAEDIIDYFNEMITDRQENGESEEEILASLGDPQLLVSSMFPDAKNVKDDNTEKSAVQKSRFQNVDRIDIDSVTYDFRFVCSPDDAVSIEYEEDRYSSLSLKLIKNSCLKIEQDYAFGGLDQLFSSLSRMFKKDQMPKRSYQATIYLPKGIDLKIENVSGDLLFDGISCRENRISTVSGDLIFEDGEYGNLKIDSLSGDVTISNLRIDEDLDADLTSGNLIASYLYCEEIDIDTLSGNVELGMETDEEDSDIRISRLNKSTDIKRNGKCRIKVDTLSGKVSYSFRN